MEIAKINKSELAKVEENSLNTAQLEFILSKTPTSYVKERQGKGGRKFKYVSGGYIKKVLNLMFGWDWDFEVVSHETNLQAKQVVVLGKLTCRSNGRQIVKMQFGRADIKFYKGKDQAVDLGNDMKAASTDALKKCASEIGIAADVYSPDEFKEVDVVDDVVYTETAETVKLALSFMKEQETINSFFKSNPDWGDDEQIIELFANRKSELENTK